MGAQEAREYWDRRHAAEDELRSGGNIGLSHEANQLLYALRVARLIEVLDYQSAPLAPLRLLDAGCGKGYFARSLASFGHLVDGIDTSPHAVELCRQQADERQLFAVSSLAAWRPPYLYDAVLCIDVLFHVLDDEEWRDSIVNLAALVRLGGRLVLADVDAEQDRVWATHQKTRSAARYRELLAGLGLRYSRFVPNGFPGVDVGFHVALRSS